jgi:hypothetical protein
MVLQGTFSKGKEPAGITGSASPGGGGTPPKVTVLKEFYFFDISSSSTEPHPAKRKAK